MKKFKFKIIFFAIVLLSVTLVVLDINSKENNKVEALNIERTSQLAIYVRNNADDKYRIIKDEEWPFSSYFYEKSVCYYKNGEELSQEEVSKIISVSNNKIIMDTSASVFCDMYFMKKNVQRVSCSIQTPQLSGDTIYLTVSTNGTKFTMRNQNSGNSYSPNPVRGFVIPYSDRIGKFTATVEDDYGNSGSCSITLSDPIDVYKGVLWKTTYGGANYGSAGCTDPNGCSSGAQHSIEKYFDSVDTCEQYMDDNKLSSSGTGSTSGGVTSGTSYHCAQSQEPVKECPKLGITDSSDTSKKLCYTLN